MVRRDLGAIASAVVLRGLPGVARISAEWTGRNWYHANSRRQLGAVACRFRTVAQRRLGCFPTSPRCDRCAGDAGGTSKCRTRFASVSDKGRWRIGRIVAQAGQRGAEARSVCAKGAGTCSKIRETLERTLAELASQRSEIASLRQSSSWRVTAPLRTVGELLRRAIGILR